MRILLISTFFAPDSGAAAVRLTRVAKQFVQRGHEVTVLTAMPHYPHGKIADAYRGKFTVTEELDGVRVVRAWLWATPSSKISLRLISQLSFMIVLFLRGLALPRPDVVLVESQPVFTGLGALALSRIKRVPYVQNVSDLWPEYLVAVGAMQPTHPVYRVFKALINLAQRGAAGIVALYPSILDSIKERIGDGKNRRLIFNAVDLQRFRPGLDTSEFRAKYDIGDKRVVSFVGTFGTHIDFNTMLDTAAHFAGRNDVKFVFIGTGGQREKLQERLAKGDLNHVQWIGWIDHQEMPLAWASSYITFWAIQNHDLYRYILQSKLFEAFASGTPVAIAVEGITTDIVTRSGGGFTVPFSDSAALAAAIDRLLQDETLRENAGKAARAYAEANFDPERVVTGYEEVLQAAIQQL